MTSRNGGSAKPTPQEKLAQFRANAKQASTPVGKKPVTPKASLNLNPPAPGGTIRRQQAMDAAALARNKMPQQKPASPKHPSHAFNAASARTTAPPKTKSGIQTPVASASREKSASLQAKRDFAKAAAKRAAPVFNRVAGIAKTR